MRQLYTKHRATDFWLQVETLSELLFIFLFFDSFSIWVIANNWINWFSIELLHYHHGWSYQKQTRRLVSVDIGQKFTISVVSSGWSDRKVIHFCFYLKFFLLFVLQTPYSWCRQTVGRVDSCGRHCWRPAVGSRRVGIAAHFIRRVRAVPCAPRVGTGVR